MDFRRIGIRLLRRGVNGGVGGEQQGAKGE